MSQIGFAVVLPRVCFMKGGLAPSLILLGEKKENGERRTETSARIPERICLLSLCNFMQFIIHKSITKRFCKYHEEGQEKLQ